MIFVEDIRMLGCVLYKILYFIYLNFVVKYLFFLEIERIIDIVFVCYKIF